MLARTFLDLVLRPGWTVNVSDWMDISQPNAIDRLLSSSTCKGEDVCQAGLLRSSLIHSPVFSSPARFSSFAGFIKTMNQHTDAVINTASCNAAC